VARPKSQHFPEIGDRLRAYRVGSNRSVDEVAQKLGVSRAAVYRYEQGEVVKIETIARLGRLLGVPLTALLGADIEFISNGIAFFERLRQIEQQALSMVVLYGPIAYVLTSPEYDSFLQKALAETYSKDAVSTTKQLDSLMESLLKRKANFQKRKTGIVSISSVPEVERFLTTGLIAKSGLSQRVSLERRAHAIREVRHIAGMLRHPPMGVQVGLVIEGLPVSGFQIVRQPDRNMVVTSPFRIGDIPNIRIGVASINDMDHVVQIHEDIANELWAEALTGEAAAKRLEAMADNAEAVLNS